MGYQLSLLHCDCTDLKRKFEGVSACKAAATPVASTSETEELRRIKDEAYLQFSRVAVTSLLIL